MKIDKQMVEEAIKTFIGDGSQDISYDMPDSYIDSMWTLVDLAQAYIGGELFTFDDLKDAIVSLQKKEGRIK